MIEYVKRLAGPFTAEGATNLPFGFKIFDPTDVFVAASTDPNTSSTALVYGKDYSVKMNEDQDTVPGGTVVLSSPISTGQVVVIGSAVAYTQNTQLTNFSRFPPEIINESLDRIVVQIQQLVELTGRTISLPPTSSLTVGEFLENLLNAAKDAAKSADEAAQYARICEEIKQNIFIYSWDIPHVVDTLDDVEKYPYDGFFAVGGYGDPGHRGQDISNRVVKARGSTELRTLGERFSDVVNVRDFGAKGDGITDDTEAISAMATSAGRLVFPSGIFACNTLNIVVPVFFLPGGELSVNDGAVVTISSSIEAGKQKIFGGAGRVVLAHDNVENTGENARQVHAAWFGVFPFPLPVADQGPAIQKICDSVGDERESEILFDIGNYYVDSSVAVPRACAIVGKGQRRTVFKTRKEGFPLFKTNQIACRFKGVQFEIVQSAFSATQKMRLSPFIEIAHEMCDLQDIAVGHSFENIVIKGERCKVDGVIASFSGRLGVGSSVVKVAANDVSVRNVFCGTSSAAGVDSVVLICPEASNISSILIDNVSSIMASKCVSVQAKNARASNVRITNIRHNGFTSDKPAAIVEMVASGQGSISSVAIDGVLTSGYCDSVVFLDGAVSHVLIDNVSSTGAAARGVQISGAVSDVVVSDTVDLRECSVPFDVDRTASRIQISPVAEGGRTAVSKSFVVNPGGAYKLDLRRTVLGGMAALTSNASDFALFVLRAAKSNPHATPIASSSAIAYASTALTGSTGAAGKITIGMEDRTLYVENRLDSARTFSFSLLDGNL